MKAIDYMQRIIREGASYVPTDMAESVRNAMLALGYVICVGALDWSNCNVVLYLD